MSEREVRVDYGDHEAVLRLDADGSVTIGHMGAVTRIPKAWADAIAALLSGGREPDACCTDGWHRTASFPGYCCPVCGQSWKGEREPDAWLDPHGTTTPHGFAVHDKRPHESDVPVYFGTPPTSASETTEDYPEGNATLADDPPPDHAHAVRSIHESAETTRRIMEKRKRPPTSTSEGRADG